MKYFAFFVFFLILSVFIWPQNYINLLSPSELKYKSLLFLNKSKLEDVLKEAAKTDYVEIFEKGSMDVRYARTELSGEQIKYPATHELVKMLNKHDIKGFWTRRQDTWWLIMEMYEVSIDGMDVQLMYAYGNEPNYTHCSKLAPTKKSEDFCYEQVFNSWFVTKYWM